MCITHCNPSQKNSIWQRLIQLEWYGLYMWNISLGELNNSKRLRGYYWKAWVANLNMRFNLRFSSRKTPTTGYCGQQSSRLEQFEHVLGIAQCICERSQCELSKKKQNPIRRLYSEHTVRQKYVHRKRDAWMSFYGTAFHLRFLSSASSPLTPSAIVYGHRMAAVLLKDHCGRSPEWKAPKENSFKPSMLLWTRSAVKNELCTGYHPVLRCPLSCLAFRSKEASDSRFVTLLVCSFF